MTVEYKELSIKMYPDRMQVLYKSVHNESIGGLKGPWESTGTMGYLYKIDGYFVMTNPFSNKPIKIFKYADEVISYFKEQTGLVLKIEKE